MVFMISSALFVTLYFVIRLYIIKINFSFKSPIFVYVSFCFKYYENIYCTFYYTWEIVPVSVPVSVAGIVYQFIEKSVAL